MTGEANKKKMYCDIVPELKHMFNDNFGFMVCLEINIKCINIKKNQ